MTQTPDLIFIRSRVCALRHSKGQNDALGQEPIRCDLILKTCIENLVVEKVWEYEVGNFFFYYIETKFPIRIVDHQFASVSISKNVYALLYCLKFKYLAEIDNLFAKNVGNNFIKTCQIVQICMNLFNCPQSVDFWPFVARCCQMFSSCLQFTGSHKYVLMFSIPYIEVYSQNNSRFPNPVHLLMV